MKAIQRELAKFRDARDWGRYHTPKNLALAIASEAGEVAQLYRFTDSSGAGGPDGRSASEVTMDARGEVADVMIFALQFCNSQGWDAEEIIREKMEFNEIRNPAEES